VTAYRGACPERSRRDVDSRVTGLSYTAGQHSLGNLSYTYDADGRRTVMGEVWQR
jgi:hypothetical protein